VALRGYYGSVADGGVGCLHLAGGASGTYAVIGSRLLYNGKVTVVSEL
jgi:hypothetical protein